MNHPGPYIFLPDAPSIPALTFRLFQGAADLPALADLRQKVQASDGDIWFPGPDTNPLSTCDPLQDCLVVEIGNTMVGFTWLDWWAENDGRRLYLHLGWLVPEWRRKGIGHAILHWQENRLRQIASMHQTHQSTGVFLFGGNADEAQIANRALLLSEGYQVAFTLVEMICHMPIPPIQVAPLPDGLQVRPVAKEHFPAIYAANDEAFQESRYGYSRMSSEDFFQNLINTHLWFVAWDGDRVAGLVINEINKAGGYTPWVAVRRPWRRLGLGQALMTRSIQCFQERGIKQASIMTVAENPNRSVHLYESVGYRIVKRQPRYRKAM
jgi:mycothiol synthase